MGKTEDQDMTLALHVGQSRKPAAILALSCAGFRFSKRVNLMSYQIDDNDKPQFPWLGLVMVGLILWLAYMLGWVAGRSGC